MVVGRRGLELRGHMSHSKKSVQEKERGEGGGSRERRKKREEKEGKRESHDLWETEGYRHSE